MAPILLGTLILLALAWIALALGSLLMRLLRLETANPQEHVLFSVGLGIGALQVVPFTLFALGIGRPPVFCATLTAVALALIPSGLSALKNVREWIASLRPLETWQGITMAVFAALLALIYIRAMSPATSHDDLSYHLAASTRYLDAGGFRFLPTLTYTNWPISVELLFATVMAIHREAPVAVVQFLFGLVTLGAAFAIAHRAAGVKAGAAACTLLLVYKVFWEEMTVAHVDLGTAAYATLAVLCLMRARDSADSARSWTTGAAVFAGLAATTKLSGIWVVISISILAALNVPRRTFRSAIGEFARCSLIGILIVAPWLARTWIITGNPVYPALYGLFGGIEWTAEGWPRLQHYFRLFNSPPGLPPTPANLALAKAGIIVAGIVVLAATFHLTRRSNLALPARFAALFVAFFVVGSAFQLRLIMAALPSIFACGGAAMTRIPPVSGPVIAGLCVVLGIFSATGSYLDHKSQALKVAVGIESRESHYVRNVPDFPAVKYVNSRLPPDSRILVGTWEEQTALYRPLALRANYWLQDSVHYETQSRLVEDLKRLSVTHLVYKPMNEDWCGGSKICTGRREIESRALATLAKERGTALGSWNGVTLYRLDLKSVPRPGSETEPSL